MKRILVVGGSGFLGQNIARHFHGNGAEVAGIGGTPLDAGSADCFARFDCLRLPSGDLDSLLREFEPELVVNCAGAALVGRSFSSPEEDFLCNVSVVSGLLESLRTVLPDCRFVQLSSAAVYGNPRTLPVDESADIAPISPYGYHKRQAELLVEEYANIYQMRSASVRIFSAYGPGLSKQVLWDLSRKIASNGLVEIHGDGSESRDFIHSKDVARGIETVVSQAPMNGEIYNLATGRETEIREVLRILLEEFGVEREVRYTGVVGEGVPRRWCADISRIGELGFEPAVSVSEGLRDYVNWFSEMHG